MVKYNLSDDYYKTYDQKVRNLSLEDVQKLSSQIIIPENMNWFVVWDKEKIITSLEEIGFDEIIIVDGDGNQISPENKKVEVTNDWYISIDIKNASEVHLKHFLLLQV